MARRQHRRPLRRRALEGWYQALNTQLLQKVEIAARHRGLVCPTEGSHGFAEIATVEAPGLFRQVQALKKRI